jgi:ferredoxin-NADP reductase
MKLKLISKHDEAGNAKTFVFEPEQPLTWTAGQFMHYGLQKPDGVEDTMERFFTISSAPFTGKPQITTRISRSPFKQALNKLEISDTIEATPPEGDFVWEDSERPIVFLAGGIGVTPFHSIIAERAHKGQRLDLTLIYANRDEEIIFKEELDAIAKAHPEFKLKYVLGHPLDIGKVLQAAPNISDSLIYISGAEGMVEDISRKLDEEAKITNDQLRQDFFPGYNYESF